MINEANKQQQKTSISLPILLKIFRGLPLPYKLGLLERLFGRSLSERGVCWVETSNHIRWKLDLREVTNRWIVYGDYEGQVQMGGLRRWLNNGGVVIDSGANIGQMLLFLAPLPGVSVYAFEPLASIADWLEECVNNYPDWKIHVVRQGLSHDKREIIIQVDGARSTARMDWYVGKELPIQKISVINLDDFLWANSIKQVRLWKLDVEGYEMEALRGAEWHLKNGKIEAALIEMSGATEVVQYLDECGYDLYRITKRHGVVLLDKTSSSSLKGNVVALRKPDGQAVLLKNRKLPSDS